MIGGGPYDVSTCPFCGGVMWNGWCEDCKRELSGDENDDENDN